MVARRGGREGDSHHLGSHHLGAVSGAFPVNQRGRRWFIWRSLRAGRRMRRPDTDLSTPPRAGCTRRRPFRSSGEGTGRRRGQSSFGPGVLRRRSDRWDPESADFAADHRSSWSRGQTETTPMKRPGTPHRAGRSREGDSHHFGSHHLGTVSGAFPVNQRGRRWFIWRSLRAGRRMRRPYTDLSTPRRVGCTRRRPFRSSGEGTVEKAGRRGQSSFGRDGEKGTVII